MKKAIVFFSLIFSAYSPVSNAETLLRVQTAQNAGDFVIKRLNDIWVPKLQEMSNDELNIELLPTNSVVPYKDTPKAVQNGIIDGQMTTPNYFSGKNQAFALFGDLIAAYESPDQGQTYCRLEGGEQVLQKLYDGVFGKGLHVIGCGPYAKEALASAIPIRSFNDLEGKKIRAPEGLASQVFKAAGATPVSMSFSEVYTALETGLVDAADASALTNNERMGVNDVARYPIYPGIHSQPVHSFSLNQSKWDALSKTNQEIIKIWYYAAYDDLRRSADIEDKKVARIINDRENSEVIDWSAEDRKKFRDVARSVWEKYSNSNAEAKMVYDSEMKYLKAINLF